MGNTLAYNRIIFRIVTLFALVASLTTYILSFELNSHFKLLFLLPLTYAILFSNSKINKQILPNIGISIINVILFIRYTIYPLLLVLSPHLFLGDINNVEPAIYLMTFECISVFITIKIFGKRLFAVKQTKAKIYFKTNIDVIIISALIMFIVAIILYPNLLLKYIDWNAVGVKSISGVLGIFFKIGIDLVFLIIVGFFYKRSKSLGSFTALALSLLFAGILIFGELNREEGNVSRWGFLIYFITIIILLSKLYPLYAKRLSGFGIPIFLFLLLLLSLLKFDFDFSHSYIFGNLLTARSLDYYFMGIENISIGLSMNSIYDANITIKTMLTDMFSALPVFSSFFDATKDSTPTYYHQFMGRTDSIIPTLVQSSAYFGVLGSTVFSILFVVLTIEFNRMANQTTNVFLFFILIQLTILFSLSMAININIIQQSTWYRLIFISLIFLNNKLPIIKTAH